MEEVMDTHFLAGDKAEANRLELVNYQIQELRALISYNREESEKRLDKKDAEQAALLLRVDALESWRDMRLGEMKKEKERRDNQARFTWGLLGSTVMLFIHALWSTLRTHL